MDPQSSVRGTNEQSTGSITHKVSMATGDLVLRSRTPEPPDSTHATANSAYNDRNIIDKSMEQHLSELPSPSSLAPANNDSNKVNLNTNNNNNNNNSNNNNVSNNNNNNNNPPMGMAKSNQVRTVMLNGVPIVALVIDGKERLCLAQISNTLLKSFSYNEIHNRRVALGITCVQCTPVQLEILRRAGAMPISSRRCGMITKREAERLCKSFLTENIPPKLPDNFAFDVYHACAWGCRGSFVPSRYNSSRAKCIKCNFCGLFFSPNKFIFHSHRLPDSKYTQPDAANFNSWRRHLKLAGEPDEDTVHAWEDVKAMFNGGSRRRVMIAHASGSAHSGGSSSSTNSGRFHLVKRARLVDQSSPTPQHLPVVPYPNKNYHSATATPPTPQVSQHNPYLPRPPTDSCIRQGFAEYMWGSSTKQITLPTPPFPPSPYHPFAVLPPPPPPPPPSCKLGDDVGTDCPRDVTTPTQLTRPHSSCSRESQNGTDQQRASDIDDPFLRRNDSKPFSMASGYLSAFRPVVRAQNAPPGGLLVRPMSSDPFSVTPTEEGRVTSSTRADRDSVASSTGGAVSSSSDGENVDIEMTTDDERSGPPFVRPASTGPAPASHGTPSSSVASISSPPPSLVPMVPTIKHAMFVDESTLTCKQVPEVGLNLTSSGKVSSECDAQQSKLSCLSKEELEEILVHETQARRRAEKEFQLMKESFHEQVKREVAYREEMLNKQLHLVRGRDTSGARSLYVTAPIDPLSRIGAGEESEVRRIAETQRGPRRTAPFFVQDVDFAAMYRMRLQTHPASMNSLLPSPYQQHQQPQQQQQQQQQQPPPPHHHHPHNKQCDCGVTPNNKSREIVFAANGLHDHWKFHLFSGANDLFGASWS